MRDKIVAAFRRLRYYSKKDIFTVHNIVFAVAIFMCGFFIIGTVNATARNWTLEQKLKGRQLELTKMKIEVDTLKLEQEYYQTEEYQELTARAKAGKMLPGETMVVLPRNSATALEKYNEAPEEIPSYRSNFSEWLDFLFG
jgi:Septum formation initiator.